MTLAAGEDVRTTSTQALKLNVPSSLTLYANVPLFCGCISLFMTVYIVAPNYVPVSGPCRKRTFDVCSYLKSQNTGFHYNLSVLKSL